MAISKAKKGKPNGLLGRKYSDKHRKNLSAGLTGLPSKMKGKKQSDDLIRKRIESRIKNNSFPNSVKIKNLETGEIFNSKAEASRKHLIPITNLSRLIKKQKGWIKL